LGNFLKITEVAQILGPVFPQCKSCIKFLNVMGDFIKKPSDHPVQCLKDWNMERFCPTSGIYFRSFQAIVAIKWTHGGFVTNPIHNSRESPHTYETKQP
jgi:hypothetical protein